MTALTGKLGVEAQSRFFRSVGAMLGAGMPLVSCLRSEEGKSGRRGGAAALLLRKSVEGGMTLSEAMGAIPGTFDAVAVGMIRAAESSGRLSETMARIADMQDARAKLRKRVRAALIYPAVVMLVAIAVCWFLSVFILPILTGFLEGRPAPWPTRVVMGFGAWIAGPGKYFPIVLIVLGILLRLVGRTAPGSRFFDACVLQIPVAGGIARKVAIARFARVYGSLVQGGVPVLQALDLSAGAIGNSVIGNAILRSRAAVEQGEPLSAALATERSIPAELVEMMRSGEKSGAVDQMLDSVATYYEQEVDAALSMLPALIQPILILFIGAVVLLVAMSVFMTLWSVVDTITM